LWQPLQPLHQPRILEAKTERRDQRSRRREEIVGHDQPLPPREPLKQSHKPATRSAIGISIPTFAEPRHPAVAKLLNLLKPLV
jgi:hypothetical protein